MCHYLPCNLRKNVSIHHPEEDPFLPKFLGCRESEVIPLMKMVNLTLALAKSSLCPYIAPMTSQIWKFFQQLVETSRWNLFMGGPRAGFWVS